MFDIGTPPVGLDSGGRSGGNSRTSSGSRSFSTDSDGWVRPCQECCAAIRQACKTPCGTFGVGQYVRPFRNHGYAKGLIGAIDGIPTPKEEPIIKEAVVYVKYNWAGHHRTECADLEVRQ